MPKPIAAVPVTAPSRPFVHPRSGPFTLPFGLAFWGFWAWAVWAFFQPS